MKNNKKTKLVLLSKKIYNMYKEEILQNHLFDEKKIFIITDYKYLPTDSEEKEFIKSLEKPFRTTEYISRFNQPIVEGSSELFFKNYAVQSIKQNVIILEDFDGTFPHQTLYCLSNRKRNLGVIETEVDYVYVVTDMDYKDIYADDSEASSSFIAEFDYIYNGIGVADFDIWHSHISTKVDNFTNVKEHIATEIYKDCEDMIIE